MTFTVKERVLLLQIIPQAQGDVTALRLIHRFLDDLSFSEAEHAELNFQTSPEGVTTWTVGPTTPLKEIEIGKKLREVIEKTLKHVLDEMNKDPKGQPLQLFEVLDKFFPVEE
jgi:hypothetical protein